MSRCFIVFFVILWCGLAGCATLPLPANASHDEAAYTALYPYYLEFCALSEIQKKPGYGADIRGGVGGHSTIYLNGVCLAGPGYPELAICPADPASNGVGLSVNAHFSNANWIAIPGRDFFYHGDLKPGQALTRQVYDATKAHAKRLGIYDAIRFHDRVFEDMPPGYTRDAFKYEVSIATDYAVGYGRDRYCARVPVTRAQMARIVDYLNGLNRPYRDGKAEYQWSVLNDNCIHVAHNALAVDRLLAEYGRPTGSSWRRHLTSRCQRTNSSTSCDARTTCRSTICSLSGTTGPPGRHCSSVRACPCARVPSRRLSPVIHDNDPL